MGVEPGLGEGAAETGIQGFAQKRWEPLGGSRAQHQSQCLCPQKRGLAEPRTGDQIPSNTRLPSFLSWAASPSPHLRVSLRILLRNQALLSQQSPPSPSTPPQCSNAQCFCTLPRAQPRKQQDKEIYTLHTHASPHDYLPQVGPVELCLTRSHYGSPGIYVNHLSAC